MEKLKNFKKIEWFKPDWNLPTLDDEASQLLKQCADMSEGRPNQVDLKDFMAKSEAFPISFPIDSIRIKTLKTKVPEDTLKRNILSTYPLLHERVLRLMAQFIVYKRKYGSNVEKEFYKTMTIPQFIDRILKKRAINFMSKRDKYMLITGEKGFGNWEIIGTDQQKDPLTLSKCLSYDELKISAMFFVSSYTVCINDGARRNKGVFQDGVEQEAVIIGVIGPRFQREERMDCQDMLITHTQNKNENGFGETGKNDSQTMWRKLWSDFYEVQSFTYSDASLKMSEQTTHRLKKDEKNFSSRLVLLKDVSIFDNEAYYKRISIIAETCLLEAEIRAQEAGKNAFLNVIGCGLGVWKISSHQNDVFVLTFVERIRALLRHDAVPRVTDVNFAYIAASATLKAYFKNPNSDKLTMFIKSEGHPKGGINITIRNREPSSKLSGEHAGKLLVMTYPWDGNAHPGNEFWIGKLASSGDPAAACSTQISELHNAYINDLVSPQNTRVATQADIRTLHEYCKQ